MIKLSREYIVYWKGNETITINGTNLPATATQIQIGEKKIAVISASSTKITVKSVPMAPGLYDLKIPTGALGVAK